MNNGFAMAGGMNEALGISVTISGLAAGIFFFGYIILQIHGGHIAECGSAKRIIMWTAWGDLSTIEAYSLSANHLFGGGMIEFYLLLTN